MALNGDRVKAQATVTDRQDTTGTTVSTSYTATLTGGTACGKSFVAPASGQVEIKVSMNGFNAGGNAFCAPQVRTGGVVGSGTLVLTASDPKAWLVTGGNSMTFTFAVLLTGLTEGSTYNVQTMFRVSAGTGTFAWKELVVTPQV